MSKASIHLNYNVNKSPKGTFSVTAQLCGHHVADIFKGKSYWWVVYDNVFRRAHSYCDAQDKIARRVDEIGICIGEM